MLVDVEHPYKLQDLPQIKPREFFKSGDEESKQSHKEDIARLQKQELEESGTPFAQLLIKKTNTLHSQLIRGELIDSVGNVYVAGFLLLCELNRPTISVSYFVCA
jgi:hypothetical protein